MIAWLLISFAVMMLFGVPIGISLGLSAMGGILLLDGGSLVTVTQRMFEGMNSWALLAIPLYTFAGYTMSKGGISQRLMDFCYSIVGHIYGGLAHVNILASMIFAGISGSAVADVSSLGSIVVPMMKKQGYKPEFAVGLTVTTACQGVLIPPSHNMVIYALATGGAVTVGNMLIAGMLPGILLGACLMLLCFFLANHYHFPKGEGISYKGRRARILLSAIPPMMIFVIIMGGVAAGVFTATESSAIACLYTFALTYIFTRSAKLRNFNHVLRRALKTLAIVMTLIATAQASAYMMTALRIPDQITRALLAVTSNKYLLLLLINALLILLGCFMDMAPLIMIMTPILLPVVTSPVIGMHPVHFGVMLIFNLAVGLCTPPVGSALYVGCAVGKTELGATAKATLPMFGMMVIVLMIVTFVPAISLWLPGLL